MGPWLTTLSNESTAYGGWLMLGFPGRAFSRGRFQNAARVVTKVIVQQTSSLKSPFITSATTPFSDLFSGPSCAGSAPLPLD